MLEIRDLQKTYDNGVRALRSVSLDIPRGMFGLLGPNGAGKSTLMRTLATLQMPDAGSIRLGEIDVLDDPRAVRRVLGYLPQEFGVYPRVSAEALLDHFAVLKGLVDKSARREVVAALLERVNLFEVRKRKLGTFSGGMRQRFGVAQALLGDPRLVIVDEPTAGLDPLERNRFLDLLAEIGENVVVILSTHIVEDVRDLCERVAILSQGTLLAEGRPHDMVAALDGRVWRRLFDKAELDAVRDELPVISDRLFRGKRAVHIVTEATAPRADGFEPVAASLEDVYFDTLRRAGDDLAAAA